MHRGSTLSPKFQSMPFQLKSFQLIRISDMEYKLDNIIRLHFISNMDASILCATLRALCVRRMQTTDNGCIYVYSRRYIYIQ